MWSVVFERLETAHAEIAIDLCQLSIETLVEAQFDSIGASLLETSEVLLMLSNDIRLVGEDTCWLKIKHQSSEVSSRDVVLKLIIALHGVLVSQELVDVVHLAKSHVAGQLSYSHFVFGIGSQHSPSFQFDSHGSHILDKLLDQFLDLIQRLLRAHSENWYHLKALSKRVQSLLELS